ncbi:MAG: hypothetical protein ACTHJ5_07710 [Ilyomonas sp.]
MRNPLYNDDFENYLQQQVKDHRMYPSDHIWRNIQENIHGERKWPALTFISIFIISSLVVSTLLMKPNKQIELASIRNSTPSITPEEKEKVAQLNAIATEEVLEQHLTANHITQQTIAEVSESTNKRVEVTTQVQKAGVEDIESIPTKSVKAENQTALQTTAITKQGRVLKAEKPDLAGKIVITALPPVVPNSFYLPAKDAKAFPDFQVFQALQIGNLNDYNIWKSYPITTSALIKRRGFPKLDFQFYVTPSVSYRRLIDEKTGNPVQSFVSAIPVSANYSLDVNQVVHHRPALGSEVGFALGYHLSKTLTLKTGLQFNIRRYNIEAYSYNMQASSVTLSDNNSVDTLNTYSIYRNYALSSTPIVLHNTYYEIALPVGIDWQILQSGRLSWNVAGSIQPTYTFDKEPFIITSDYKNYADGSLLMRNWNVNTSFETYIGYKVGEIRWQIGPQFRYQQMPTYSNKYPIREYLLDYGLKVGFTKSLGNK